MQERQGIRTGAAEMNYRDDATENSNHVRKEDIWQIEEAKALEPPLNSNIYS